MPDHVTLVIVITECVCVRVRVCVLETNFVFSRIRKARCDLAVLLCNEGFFLKFVNWCFKVFYLTRIDG